MEFPDLGDHCAERTCRKLDFLPLKCDGCDDFYCSEHFSYKAHGCSSGRRDYQVPICPLCQQPVPTPPNASPDESVSRHLDSFCVSERRRIYTNRCSYRNCKRKEVVPIKCHTCNLNFCLKHRHCLDHACDGPDIGRQRAAFSRITDPKPANPVEQVQGTMTEDEALSRAIFNSLQDSPKYVPPPPPVDKTSDRCSLS